MIEIIVTNGGPHPPDKWAALIASQIGNLISIDENSASEAATAARKAKPRFCVALAESLEPIIADVCAAERQAVESGTVKRRHDPFVVDMSVDQAIAAVSAEAENTQFRGWFAEPDLAQVIRRIIHQNIIDAANIERSWALDAKGL